MLERVNESVHNTKWANESVSLFRSSESFIIHHVWVLRTLHAKCSRSCLCPRVGKSPPQAYRARLTYFWPHQCLDLPQQSFASSSIRSPRKTFCELFWFLIRFGIKVYLIATQLLVGVLVDFLEHIRCGWGISNINKLNVKQKCSTTWNHISSSTVSVAEIWWNRQFSLFTWN